MKERGILFSAPMVRATLSGAKSQTRQIVKPRKCPDTGCELACCEIAGERGEHLYRICPFGAPGDRLWVRETWGDCTPGADALGGTHYDAPWYRADADSYGLLGHDGFGPVYVEDIKWRPSIHMPRNLSRITLEITAVRVERLQDISEADAVAEGVVEHQTLDGRRACNIDGGPMMACGPIHAYRALWESINGPGSWDANPWVWVIEFRRIAK